MTTAAPATTPLASSPEALNTSIGWLEDAQADLQNVDLRSIKGPLREGVKQARFAVDSALKIARTK